MYDYLITHAAYLKAIQACEDTRISLEVQKEIILENVSKLKAGNEGETVTSFGNTMETLVETASYASAVSKLEGMQRILEEELPKVNTLLRYVNNLDSQLDSAYYRTPVAAGEEYVPPGEGKLALNEASANAAVEKCRQIQEINEEIRMRFRSMLIALEGYLPESGQLQEALEKACNKVNRIENLEKAVTRYSTDVKDLSNLLKYRIAGLSENPNDLRKRTDTYPPMSDEDKKVLEESGILELAGAATTDPEKMRQFLEEVAEGESVYSEAVMQRIAETVFAGFEGDTADEKIKSALSLKGEITGVDYIKVYGYLSGEVEGSPYVGEYTQTQLYQIAMHFAFTETEPGNEMPKWWVEKYITCPEHLKVTEENVKNMWEEEEYVNYYIKGYLVLDMISGMGNARREMLLGTEKCDSNWVIQRVETGNVSEVFGIWYDYNYGAVSEYVSGQGTVRSVKYVLGEKYGFIKDYDETGNYKVYTNEITELSELQQSAYLSKYGKYEDFYEKFWGAKTDPNEQLYEYFKEDTLILSLTEAEKEFLLSSGNMDLEEGEFLANYRDIKDLRKMLEQNMAELGIACETDLEGNQIIIRGVYGANWEYSFELEGEEVFGSTYISIREYMEQISGFSKYRIENGIVDIENLGELQTKAKELMITQLGEDTVASMPEDEYWENLNECVVITDISEQVCMAYLGGNSREVDTINKIKDTAIGVFSLVVLAAALLYPPTSPWVIGLGILDGVIAVGDGAIRISQGDEVGGIFESIMGAIGLIGLLKSAQAIRGAKAITDDVLRGMDNTSDEVVEGISDVISGEKAYKRGSGSYSLLPGEGEIGTYRDLLDAGEVGDNITPHHMPSAEYMAQHGVGKKDGLCMNMEMPSPGTGGRHRLTDTYGRNMTDAEKAYYYSLSPRDALAYDIANMRQIYQSQGLYSEIRPKLQEYIKQYKELMPELFDK